MNTAVANKPLRLGTVPGSANPLSILTIGVAAVLAVPVIVVVLNVFVPGSGTWTHLAATVLPGYVSNSLGLLLGVAYGVVTIGVTAAWLTTMCQFPGRRFLEGALLLPMAMPAYVMAYAYTDLLQFAGPVQTALREWLSWGRGDYWFPDVRSLAGAVVMLSFVLYPYVYLLARAAFLEQSESMLEVARASGYGAWRTFAHVALPLARPGIAAGTALALMETLADFGTVSYFGVETFTTGIYRAWFSLGDHVAAAQLSAMLLGFVVAVLIVERLSRGRAGFHNVGHRRRFPYPYRLQGFRAFVAFTACAIPLALGFFVPAGILLNHALDSGGAGFGARYADFTFNTVTLALCTAALAVVLALLVGYATRTTRSRWVGIAHRIAGLGYAVPGAVIAVGVLIPVTRLDHALARVVEWVTGAPSGLLLTGGIAALVYAYLVRFFAVSLQTIEAGLAKVTPNMHAAARSLGLGPAATLARVHAPLLWRSTVVAGLLVFVDVMKELPATFVMRPFNFDTLAVQAFNFASDERLAEASAAGLTIVAAGLLPMLLLAQFMLRERTPAAA
jgi:iron(III) transport system permease protein